ncbi:MAG TPA: hypothetical protein VNX47_05910 [Nevskia sp.]|jgi:hypothetical protein|nr:hypothetical protein [Nevskia sp.]
MKLTATLASHLYRPASKNPLPVLGLTLNNTNPTMTWTVADQVLTTYLNGSPVPDKTVDLTAYTLATLVVYLNTLMGYSAVIGPAAYGAMSAVTLLDGSGSPADESLGDELNYYTSPKWALLDAAAREIQTAGNTIPNMLAELVFTTSDGEWVDTWLDETLGGLRQTGENDAALINRIASTITTIKSNNVALEKLVFKLTGITVQVVDIDWVTGSEAIFTYGGPNWNDTQITNSLTARLYPAYTTDQAIINSFGLPLDQIGQAYWGPARACNPLFSAFAVVFAPNATSAQFQAVMPIINANRMGGTLALGYRAMVMLDTNVLADVTNNLDYVAGPAGTLYSPWAG